MLKAIFDVIGKINDVLYYPILIILLLGIGLYLPFARAFCRGVSLRMLFA